MKGIKSGFKNNAPRGYADTFNTEIYGRRPINIIWQTVHHVIFSNRFEL